jgi:hypothetical protein
MKLINITFMISEQTDELGENPASVLITSTMNMIWRHPALKPNLRVEDQGCGTAISCKSYLQFFCLNNHLYLFLHWNLSVKYSCGTYRTARTRVVLEHKRRPFHHYCYTRLGYEHLEQYGTNCLPHISLYGILTLTNSTFLSVDLIPCAY